jgi:hypothetical protein
MRVTYLDKYADHLNQNCRSPSNHSSAREAAEADVGKQRNLSCWTGSRVVKHRRSNPETRRAFPFE